MLSSQIDELNRCRDKKLETYNIDIDIYYHTIVKDRPPIILADYCKKITPYLTVIFLWDKISDYLLSSRHNKLVIDRGKFGMADSDITIFTLTIIKSPNKFKRKKDEPQGLNEVMKV